MTAKDAFAAHARDELGLAGDTIAQPVQAALTSAATFAAGAAIPLAIAVAVPATSISWAVSGGSLICLSLLGALGARIGGAAMVKPTIRVTFWGAFAMAATWGIGALVGHAV